MGTLVKTSKTDNRFTTYQNEMAERILELIAEEAYNDLAALVRTIPTKKDYEQIHYAFYFKFDFGWLSHVEKFLGYEEVRNLGLYKFNYHD